MGIFLVGSLIQTIILVNDEGYVFPAWYDQIAPLSREHC